MEELCKNSPKFYDTHQDLIIELEPDILESEVKWALKNIANNKAAGADEILAEWFENLGS